jgi:hypothetical protein
MTLKRKYVFSVSLWGISISASKVHFFTVIYFSHGGQLMPVSFVVYFS